MTKSSTGTPGASNSAKSGEEEICPICLDPLPPLTWDGQGRAQRLCCGAVLCEVCAVTLLTGHAEELLQQVMAPGDLDQSRLDEIDALSNNHRCPLCRIMVPQDEDQCFAIVKRNADEHPDWVWPLSQAGKYYAAGKGCPKDLEKSRYYYQEAAERGDVKAQHEMGNIYFLGQGVTKSTKEAMYWYTLASDQGYPLSQKTIGDMYHVEKNYKEAFRWYSIAAEQGLHVAQCNLGFFYRHGLGVAPSMELSVYWNKKASDQGFAPAMNNYIDSILTRAANANGGKFDIVGKSAVPEALYWARKAISLGNDESATLLSQLEEAVSSECANCKVTHQTFAKKFSMCSLCKASAYCSKEWQATHWRKGHKWDCIDQNGVKKTRPSTGGR